MKPTPPQEVILLPKDLSTLLPDADLRVIVQLVFLQQLVHLAFLDPTHLGPVIVGGREAVAVAAAAATTSTTTSAAVAVGAAAG